MGAYKSILPASVRWEKFQYKNNCCRFCHESLWPSAVVFLQIAKSNFPLIMPLKAAPTAELTSDFFSASLRLLSGKTQLMLGSSRSLYTATTRKENCVSCGRDSHDNLMRWWDQDRKCNVACWGLQGRYWQKETVQVLMVWVDARLGYDRRLHSMWDLWDFNLNADFNVLLWRGEWEVLCEWEQILYVPELLEKSPMLGVLSSEE